MYLSSKKGKLHSGLKPVVYSEQIKVVTQLFLALFRQYLEYCVQLCSSQLKRDTGKLQCSIEVPKMIGGLGNWTYEERLKELGIFSLEKRHLQGYLVTACQYLKGSHREFKSHKNAM